MKTLIRILFTILPTGIVYFFIEHPFEGKDEVGFFGMAFVASFFYSFFIVKLKIKSRNHSLVMGGVAIFFLMFLYGIALLGLADTEIQGIAKPGGILIRENFWMWILPGGLFHIIYLPLVWGAWKIIITPKGGGK